MTTHQQLMFNAAGAALADPQIAFVFITKFYEKKVIVSTDFQGTFLACLRARVRTCWGGL